MSEEHYLTHKEKKKALVKKNRLHQEIFNIVRLRRDDDRRVQDLKESLKPRSEEKKEKSTADKVATIRNRLNGQKRESMERWNRFAGTSGGGGRGL